MKTVKIILCTLMVLITASCSAQRTLSEVASIKGVTSVYVGKPLLRLAGGAAVLEDAQSGVEI